jgi:hypothetical protein
MGKDFWEPVTNGYIVRSIKGDTNTYATHLGKWLDGLKPQKSLKGHVSYVLVVIISLRPQEISKYISRNFT